MLVQSSLYCVSTLSLFFENPPTSYIPPPFLLLNTSCEEMKSTRVAFAGSPGLIHGPKRSTKLRASPTSNHLSQNMVRQFHENGYAVLDSFATAEEVQTMRVRAGEIMGNFVPEDVTIFSTKNQAANDYFNKSAGNISCFFEEGAFDEEGNLQQEMELSINKIGHAMHDLDPIFRQFSRSKKIAEVLTALGFKKPMPIQSMYICKQPRFGGEVIPHQDSSFLYTDPPSVTGLWLALEDACIENGCLYILPRSHVHGIHRRFYEQEDGKQGYDKPAQEYKIEDFVPLEVPAGTLVVLHGAVVHFSEENTSPKSRHAYTVHYIDAESRWDEANWLQRPADFPFEVLHVVNTQE